MWYIFKQIQIDLKPNSAVASLEQQAKKHAADSDFNTKIQLTPVIIIQS